MIHLRSTFRLPSDTMTSSSEARPPTRKAPTPAMQQYLTAKQEHPDALVFFRMGDFYEMFYEDALTAARALELTLTSRSKDSSGSPIPMCGVPHHAAETYITRLVKQGFRVALCEQIEDPKKAKGVVRRAVVRVVSPGTLTDATYLNAREPAFLLAIVSSTSPNDAVNARPTFGVALADLSTGEFSTAEYRGTTGRTVLADEISTLRPREVLLSSGLDLPGDLPEFPTSGVAITTLPDCTFDFERAKNALTDQLCTDSLDDFGLNDKDNPTAIRAAGALIQYLRNTQKADLAHVKTLIFRVRSDYLVVDTSTSRHLEIFENAEGGRPGSLIGEIDRTMTPMGGRLLRAWLLRPLSQRDPIRDRLDAVEDFTVHDTPRTKLRDILRTVHDLERLVGRTVLGTAGPRDLVSIQHSLAAIPRVRQLITVFQAPLVRSLLTELDDLKDVREKIASTIVEEPPAFARDGGCIRSGVHPELDELRAISGNAKQAIAKMEATERQRTGIGSLKIRFNRVFGYYIEVSKSNLHSVPDNYHRKQTIANAERFITPELKDYEHRILGANEQILTYEQELFEEVRQSVVAASARIQSSARSLAALDVFGALADVSATNNYTKPHIHDGNELSLIDARHPVVERHSRDAFVPNDLQLNGSDQQLVILTGPNMGGKSTYLRQTALILLMAHAGSFVPARAAKIPIIDRIFARVGASDNIARGQSTFMVEMQETAKILNTATSRSFVILDEIGRGTATFDGLSIAWAVAEHLATNLRARPKTLFATHYHELTDLTDAVQGVVNYHVAARESHDDIVFLRKVEKGRSDRSYGIQVARLAGLPPETVVRAKAILAGLEHDELSRGARPSFNGPPTDNDVQPGLFQLPPAKYASVAERLREIDIDQLTPLDALTLLSELKQELD